MPRILILAATTGYQIRAFGAAAERLGVDLVYATDRCSALSDPWQDDAVPIRFDDDGGAVATIMERAATAPIDGVIAVGDKPAVLAARVCQEIGVPWHTPEGAVTAGNKMLTRRRMRDAGVPTPMFIDVPVTVDPQRLAEGLTFPCVVKPLTLSGSRGVVRVDNPTELAAALSRLRLLLSSPDIRRSPGGIHDLVLVEDFVDGAEFAVEGLMNHGVLDVLALFDKPDPLDGPFFEETIYVTPSVVPPELQKGIVAAVGSVARVLGLVHGPIHAECRANSRGVFVLEVAPRPIGGLCSRALRFRRRRDDPDAPQSSLEEVLLRHALGEPSDRWCRETAASGVMMIPIPKRGVFRHVAGLDDARQVHGVDDIRITAKLDQLLVPIPEGASYLGFIFARADETRLAEQALRAAHARLRFTIDPELRMVRSAYG